MNTPNPVEAATSTPAASTAPDLCRGVNEKNGGTQIPIGTSSKDASATPAARRVPAPLHNPHLWAIAAVLLGLWIAIPTVLFLKGRP